MAVYKKIAGAPYVMLFFSAVALSAAYISQYFFGLNPCVLCVYQRIPYWIIIAITSLTILFDRKNKYVKVLIILCLLLFVADASIAAFHVGVEYKWWEGTDSCGTKIQPKNVEELKEMLMKAPVSRCDEPAFLFLNISMAGWNFLYAAALSCLCFFSLGRLKNEKK